MYHMYKPILLSGNLKIKIYFLQIILECQS